MKDFLGVAACAWCLSIFLLFVAFNCWLADLIIRHLGAFAYWSFWIGLALFLPLTPIVLWTGLKVDIATKMKRSLP